MADAKISSPEDFDDVQGNSDVSAICAKLGLTDNTGTDKYVKGNKGVKNVGHDVQPGWTK